jgi:hypothetical protein
MAVIAHAEATIRREPCLSGDQRQAHAGISRFGHDKALQKSAK